MKRVAFAVYRQWSYEIFLALLQENYLANQIKISLLITTPEREFSLEEKVSGVSVVEVVGKDHDRLYELLKQHDIDTVFFYGWSWLIKKPILEAFTCICLHPSPLPRYRGGSPIQNQIVAGETFSAVSIIKMDEGIDDGDVFVQYPISLAGYLPDILDRIVTSGIEGTKKYLQDLALGKVVFTPQVDLDKFPPLKRRTFADGQIDLFASKSLPYENIYNLVRGLQSPYPNAFVSMNERLLMVETVEFSDCIPDGASLLTDKSEPVSDTTRPVIATVDGFAIVTKFHFEEKQK